MKNSLNYLKLWQQKRAELPVSDSVQNDWMEMQGLLNQHLPNPVNVNKPSGSNGFNGSGLFKGLNLFIAAVAITGLVGIFIYVNKAKHHQKPINHHKSKTEIYNDSLLNVTAADSFNPDNNKNDSVSNTGSVIETNVNGELQKQQHSVGTDSSASVTNKTEVGSAFDKQASLATDINAVTTNKQHKNLSAVHKLSPANVYQSGQLVTGQSLYNRSHLPVHNDKRRRSLQPGSKSSKGTPQQSSLSNWNINTISPGSTSVLQYATSANWLTRQSNSINNDVQSDVNNYLLPFPTNQVSPIANVGQNNASLTANTNKINKTLAQQLKASQKPVNQKNKTYSGSVPSIIDWGILVGVNSQGGFTPKKQNSNLYGSLPIDPYFGLYGTYHFNQKWAVNMQLKALTSQKISGSYTHANDSKTDSAKSDSGVALKVTDSRKAYFVSVPIHVVYKLNNFVSIKAGPVINIPVKQVSGNTTLLPEIVKADSVYYKAVTTLLKDTKYDQKLNFGISGGISIQYNRLSLEATYLKNLSGYRVSSGYGSYKTSPGQVQVTIGFQLNKPKSK